MNEERRQELLRLVLQHDIDDAITRYEHESGCRITEANCGFDEAGNVVINLITECGLPHRPALTYPRTFVLNLNR